MSIHDSYFVAHGFWTTARQFLKLVSNVARECANNGNVWVLDQDIMAGPITDQQYDEQTRWSDHQIIIPVFFNLLHGIELLTKGFIIMQSASVRKTHDIRALCHQFQELFPSESTLNDFFRKYTETSCMPSLLQDFLKDNGLQANDLYQALRYPSPDFQAIRQYSSLEHREEEGVGFFIDLETEIENVSRAAVSLSRTLEP